MSFKELDEALKFIESCWDENNPDDPISFDERIEKRIHTLNPKTQRIVRNAMEGF